MLEFPQPLITPGFYYWRTKSLCLFILLLASIFWIPCFRILINKMVLSFVYVKPPAIISVLTLCCIYLIYKKICFYTSTEHVLGVFYILYEKIIIHLSLHISKYIYLNNKLYQNSSRIHRVLKILFRQISTYLSSLHISQKCLYSPYPTYGTLKKINKVSGRR